VVVVAADSAPLCDDSLSPSFDDDARLLSEAAEPADAEEADDPEGARSLVAEGAGFFAAGCAARFAGLASATCGATASSATIASAR
jgi:hypothetical protein